EQALEELWPDLGMKAATASLERTLQSLQQLLVPSSQGATGGSLAVPHLLRSEDHTLILANQSLIWVDADAFEDLLVQAFSSGDPAGVEQLLEQAMSLYAGDLLPEERHSAWTIARREHLQQSWRVLLLKLADLRIARKAFADALDPLDRLLAIDQENEAAVQRLMFALAQLKRRAEALRAYQRLASALQRHNIAPQEETRDLYEAISHASGPVTNRAPTSPADLDPPVPGAVQDEQNASMRPTTYRWQVGRSHQSPLVGRDAEFASVREVLRATLERARSSPPAQQGASLLPLDTQRRPQYVLLMGGPGLGKTRLAEEISREAQGQDWAIIWSRTYAQESNIPYRLWIEILRTMISEDPRLRAEVARRPLVYAPLSVLLPELYGLLPHLTPLPPEQEQQRLWEAVLELCTAVSEHTPLLIVLDDLQWADASSCELLTYLARRLSGHPVVFIGTCRDRELAAGHPLHALIAHLHREHGILTLQLQPLTDEQIGALVGHVPESMMRTIQTRAAGNPFFAEELARSVEAQVAAPAQAAQPDTAAYPLPDTIAAVLGLRISRLSSACQRLLGNAAVLGGSFEFNVIREMEASGSSPADEDTVLDLLDEALQAGVLTEEGRGTRISYHFWHPLLVSLLYDGLSGAKRVLLHRRAAAVLQRMYAAREEAVAATITHHLVTGGAEAEQIVHYATLAGNSAYALSAYPDAERYYRLAVENIDEQAAFQSADKRLHLAYLLEQLAECLRVRGSFEEARSLYERTLNTRRFPRPFASAVEEQYEAQIQALLWSEVGRTWYYTGDNARAQEYLDRGEQALREARVAGGPAWARLYYQRGYISWQEGRYEEAFQEGHEALRLFEGVMHLEEQPAGRPAGIEGQAGRPPGIAPTYLSQEASPVTSARRTLEGDPVDLVRTYRFLGAVANSVGRPGEALAYLNTALQLLEQHDHKREVAHICCNIGHAHLERAKHELAMTFFQRSLRLAEQLGDAPLEGVVFSNLGELAMRTGKLEEAESWFNRAIAQAEQINDQAYVSMWHAYLAPVLQDLDRLADAEACIFRALTVGRAINNTPCVGLALVALGHMRIAQMMLASESLDGTLEESATQA
nr:AAA family ATPase [Ktedonobacteraceae bacterium]